MYLYFIWGILSLLSIWELSHVGIKKYKLLYTYILIIVVVVLLSMLRWENGTDWEPYYKYYSLAGLYPEQGEMEPGFTWFCHINYQCFSYTLHLGIIAMLCIIPVANKIWKLSSFPLFSLLIWFSANLAFMFPVRQTIAISMFVYSWKYIQEKKLFYYICTILLAATFHATVLITLPVYFLWNKYIPSKIYIVVIGFFILLAFFSNHLFINLMYNIGGNLFETKLNAYLGNADETFGSAYSATQTLIRGCINRSLYFFIPLLLLNKKRQDISLLNGMFNMYFYSFILFIIVTPLSIALGRLTVYTDMSQFFLLPFIFAMKMSKPNRLLLTGIIIIYLAIRFEGVVSNYREVYIPYHCVLFN